MGYEEIKIEKMRAVVGYCDVTGFTSWFERSAVADRDVKPFIQQMKWCFLKFRERTGYFSIPTGDGIIAVLDYATAPEKVSVFSILKSLWELGEELSNLAAQHPAPRPGPARIRITEGVIYHTQDPVSDKGFPITPIDFIGEPLNLGSRLLQVHREIPHLITESALESMKPEERTQLIIKHVGFNGRAPRGVKVEDLVGLCTFQPKPS